MDTSSADRSGVIVMGMHRSGTSAMARLVGLLGLELPTETDLIPGLPSNPGGHWESRTLVDLSERILRSLGATWSSPAPLVSGWEFSPKLDPYIQEAKAALKATFSTDMWVWKDPRLCLLLPFWRRVVTPSVIVVVWRSPLDVALSLERRDEFPVDLGLALWIVYTHTMLESLEGIRVAVIRYKDMVDAPRAVAARLAEFIPGAVEPTEAVLETVDTWINPPKRLYQESGRGDSALMSEAGNLVLHLERLEGGHAPETRRADLVSPSHLARKLLSVHRVSAVQAWDLERKLAHANELLANPSVQLVLHHDIGPGAARAAVMAQLARQRFPRLASAVSRAVGVLLPDR